MSPRVKVTGSGLFSFVTVTPLKQEEIQDHLYSFQLTEITSKIRSDIESYQYYRKKHCYWHEKKDLIKELLALSGDVHNEMKLLDSQRSQGLEHYNAPYNDNTSLADHPFSVSQDRDFVLKYNEVIIKIKEGLDKLVIQGEWVMYTEAGYIDGNRFLEGNVHKLQQPLANLRTCLLRQATYTHLTPVPNANNSHKRHSPMSTAG